MNYYNPQTSRNGRFRNFLNQYSATSGSTPPLSALDRIVEGELNAESERLYRNAALQNQERSSQISDQRMQNYADYLDDAKTIGLVQSLAQLGTTGAGLIWKPKNRNIF